MFFPPADSHERTARYRRLVADTIAGLDEELVHRPSLCEGWDVHAVAAHLTMHWRVSFWQFALAGIRYRGDTDRIVDSFTRRLARRTTAEIVTDLRTNADHHSSPPMIGPMGPLADICIHLRDIARPLGLDLTASLDDWRLVLDYLTADEVKGSRSSFLGTGRLNGISLRATDQDWSLSSPASGAASAEITGPSEALVMSITGRSAALDDLSGPGVDRLQARISASVR